ncbi:hypothetical protein KKB28_10240 [bacterium]|nr:hypothetical protein [bacterium]
MSRRLRRAAFPYAAGNLANQIDIVDLSQERHQDLQQFICYRPIRKQDIRRDRWLEESVSVYGATILTIIVGLWILMVAKALPKLYMANDLLLQIFATVGLIAALVVTIIVIIPLIHVSNHVCRSDYRARRMVIANLPNIPSKHQYKVLNRKWYLYFALNLGFFIFSVFLASFVTPVFRFSPYN